MRSIQGVKIIKSIKSHRLSAILVFFLVIRDSLLASDMTTSDGISNTIMGEQCDWAGSGFDAEQDPEMREQRGITPVYLRCTQGRISWVYPRGGLRVILRLPNSRQFKGCIRVNPSFGGARIYLQNWSDKYLTKLYASDDMLPVRRARCFFSRQAQAALYVEADINANLAFPKYLAEFEYDLQPSNSDFLESCRPCKEEEMLQAYCSAELVAIGSIETVQNEKDMDTSELSVRVQKFLKKTSYDINEDRMLQNTKQTIHSSNEVKSENKKNMITIMVPRECKPKPSSDSSHFLVFMARKKFGDFSLVCAPLWHDWKQLVLHENENSYSQCLLDS